MTEIEQELLQLEPPLNSSLKYGEIKVFFTQLFEENLNCIGSYVDI